MQINTHTITITDDEKDSLGMALEALLQQEMKATKCSFNTFKDMNRPEIDLLHQFIYMGYILTIKKESKSILDFENTTDVEKWLKHEWGKRDVSKGT